MLWAAIGTALAAPPEWIPDDGIQRLEVHYWASLPYLIYYEGVDDIPGLAVHAVGLDAVLACRSPRDDVLRCEIEDARVHFVQYPGLEIDQAHASHAALVALWFVGTTIHVDLDDEGNVDWVGFDNGADVVASYPELMRRALQGLDGVASASRDEVQRRSALAAVPGVPGVVSWNTIEHGGPVHVKVGNGNGMTDGGVAGIYSVRIRTETFFDEGDFVSRDWAAAGTPISWDKAYATGRGAFLQGGKIRVLQADEEVDLGRSSVRTALPTEDIAWLRGLARRAVMPVNPVVLEPRTFIPYLDLGLGGSYRTDGLKVELGAGGFLTSRKNIGASLIVNQPKHLLTDAPVNWWEARFRYGVTSPWQLHPGGAFVLGPAWNDFGRYTRAGIELSSWFELGVVHAGLRLGIGVGIGRRAGVNTEIFDADLLFTLRAKQPRRPI